jgi:hypothetical protein
MSKQISFRKLPECDRCFNNIHNPHLFCAVHPYGVLENSEQCVNFEPDPNLLNVEWWEPEEASFYGNELVISPMQRWTRSQKLELLLWHPLFTGLCLQCCYQFSDPSERVHWDCPSCGWKDDTV